MDKTLMGDEEVQILRPDLNKKGTYTGLRDKNGYDICVGHHLKGKCGNAGMVVYGPPAFVVLAEGSDTKYYLLSAAPYAADMILTDIEIVDPPVVPEREEVDMSLD